MKSEITHFMRYYSNTGVSMKKLTPKLISYSFSIIATFIFMSLKDV